MLFFLEFAKVVGPIASLKTLTVWICHENTVAHAMLALVWTKLLSVSGVWESGSAADIDRVGGSGILFYN